MAGFEASKKSEGLRSMIHADGSRDPRRRDEATHSLGYTPIDAWREGRPVDATTIQVDHALRP
jgi:hypothetical protein